MEIYHILNRGVDKRKIFLNEQDYLRFIHDLFEFNNKDWVVSHHSDLINSDLASRNQKQQKERKLLVDILAFCLMPNHYHLLLSPKIENGITTFMRKLNMGYAKYFNIKYERKGALFEGRYKSILVKTDVHFRYLPDYIHLNPLDLIEPKWREGKINNYQKAIKLLEKYRWSSFLDYIGEKNFPSITSREYLLNVFEGEKKYKEGIIQYLKELNLTKISDLLLE